MTAPLLATRSPGQALDIESDAWVRRLSGTGRERDDAIERLHALLLRAARFEVGRRRPPVAFAGSDGVDDLAVQAADDALVAILTSSTPTAATAASPPGPTSSPCSKPL